MRIALFVFTVLSLTACSRPKAGICSTCPLWFFDPICLTGGDVPDPEPARPVTPAPKEVDLIPGQDNASYGSR